METDGETGAVLENSPRYVDVLRTTAAPATRSLVTRSAAADTGPRLTHVAPTNEEAGLPFRLLLEVVDKAPREELPRLAGLFEQVRLRCLARLTAPPPAPREITSSEGNISVKNAARRIGVSSSFIYKNAKKLPFVGTIGGRVVCSLTKLEKWNRERFNR